MKSRPARLPAIRALDWHEGKLPQPSYLSPIPTSRHEKNLMRIDSQLPAEASPTALRVVR